MGRGRASDQEGAVRIHRLVSSEGVGWERVRVVEWEGGGRIGFCGGMVVDGVNMDILVRLDVLYLSGN